MSGLQVQWIQVRVIGKSIRDGYHQTHGRILRVELSIYLVLANEEGVEELGANHGLPVGGQPEAGEMRVDVRADVVFPELGAAARAEVALRQGEKGRVLVVGAFAAELEETSTLKVVRQPSVPFLSRSTGLHFPLEGTLVFLMTLPIAHATIWSLLSTASSGTEAYESISTCHEMPTKITNKSKFLIHQQIRVLMEDEL